MTIERQATRQTVFLAPTQNRPLGYSYVQENEFLDERVNFFGSHHNGAILSGGTYSNPTSNDAHGVLDASTIDVICDKEGVRVGIVMATADGLGHSDGEQENRSTALVSSKACEVFVDSVKKTLPTGVDNIQASMQEAGEESKRAMLSPAYDSQSSLVTTTIYRQSDGKIKALIGNVGDGMVLVVDGKTGAIKHVIAARNYGHGQAGSSFQYSPHAVQALTIGNAMKVGEFIELNDVQEDDLILQMTDGIWGEFEFSVEEIEEIEEKEKEKGQHFRALKLKTQKFEAVIEEIVKDKTIPVAEIGKIIVKKLSNLALLERAHFQALKEKLKPHIEAAQRNIEKITNKTQYENYTISRWMEEIQSSGDEGVKLAEDLNQFLQKCQHDCISYALDCPVKMFIDDLNRKCFGDCATLAVMRVPTYKKELIRAYMTATDANERKILLARIENEMFPMSKEELEGLVQDLLKEKMLPALNDKNQTGYRYSSLDESYQPVYSAQRWENLKIILDERNEIRSHLKQITSASEKTKLLENLKEKLILNRDGLDIMQMSKIFSLIHSEFNAQFNVHRNRRLDKIFGIKNTKSWSGTVKVIREAALEKLFSEVDTIENFQEKKKFLEQAKREPLFNTHRDNFFIMGRVTAAVKAIDKKLTELDKLQAKQEERNESPSQSKVGSV